MGEAKARARRTWKTVAKNMKPRWSKSDAMRSQLAKEESLTSELPESAEGAEGAESASAL